MKKLLLALCLFSILGYSQEKLENALLWKISGKDINPSYLFGTIHATCDNTLNPQVLEALKNTSNLYLEIDMDDMNMQVKASQGMIMTNGTTIKSLTTEEEYKILDDFITKELGMGIAMFNSVKPFFITTALIPKMLDCPMKSIEAGLMTQVKAENEEIYGIETIEDQLAVFENIPYQDQIKELVKFAKDGMEKGKTEFNQLMKIYQSANIEKMLEETSSKEESMYSKYVDLLLNNRNKNWLKPIINACKKEASFFGVGAAHLAGKEGVINLLRQQGYTVEAVK